MTNSISDEYWSYIFPDFRAVQFILFGIESLVDQKLVFIDIIPVKGYEMYVVEQWILERRIGTILTTFTGNNNHILQATRIRITKNIDQWPFRFSKYINELKNVQQATLKTFNNEGVLHITNLASLNSDHNLNPIYIEPVYCDFSNGEIPIPLNYNQFEANFDLKRLNCAGRSALLFSDPPKASQDKFISIYKIHEQVPIVYGVKSMILMIQMALYFFDLLNGMYCDGMLCKKTQSAVQEWWEIFGSELFSKIPQDGVLGPKSVAAIFSVLISCKLRLNLLTSENSKDPFDILGFKKSIYQFQKYTKKSSTETSWLLTKPTFTKLMELSDEKLNDNILKLKQAVNKTVNDISRKNRVRNISIETTNIDELKLNVHGRRLEYLYLNKGPQPKDTNEIEEVFKSQIRRKNEKSTSRSELSSVANSNGSTSMEDYHKHSNSNSLSIDTSNYVASPGSPAQYFSNSVMLGDFLSPTSAEFPNSYKKGSASNYMNVIKNAATSRKQKLNDSITHVSKAAIKGVGLNQTSRFHHKSSGSTGGLKINTALHSPSREKVTSAQQQLQLSTPKTNTHYIPRTAGTSHHPFNTPKSAKAEEHHLSSNPLRSGVDKFRNLHNKSKHSTSQIAFKEDEITFSVGNERLSSENSRLNAPFDEKVSSPEVGYFTPAQKDVFEDEAVIANDDEDEISQTSSHDRFVDFEYQNASVAGMVDAESGPQPEVDLEFEFHFQVSKRLQRRMSEPHVLEDLNAACLGYDFEPITELITKPVRLSRSKSFSMMENTVLTWTREFGCPPESFSRSYLKTQAREIRKTTNEKANEVEITSPKKSTSGASLVSLGSVGSLSIWETAPNLADFYSLINQVQSAVLKKLETLNKTVINTFRFKEIYDNKSSEVETLISKLRYEVRILRTRVADVDHSVSELDTKVEWLTESVATS